MRRYKSPKYDTGDVIVVMVSPAATVESRKLAAVAKRPFKVTAVLLNGRYEVQDMRDLKKSNRSNDGSSRRHEKMGYL